MSRRRISLENPMSRLLAKIHAFDTITIQPIPHRAEARTRGPPHLCGLGLVVSVLLRRFVLRVWFWRSLGYPFADAGYGPAFDEDLVAVVEFAKDGALPFCVVACLAVFLFES